MNNNISAIPKAVTASNKGTTHAPRHCHIAKLVASTATTETHQKMARAGEVGTVFQPLFLRSRWPANQNIKRTMACGEGHVPTARDTQVANNAK